MKVMLLAGEESGMIYLNAIRSRINKIARENAAAQVNPFASLCALCDASPVHHPRKLSDDPVIEVRTYADYGFKTGDLAVIGFWPVIKRLRFFLGVKKTMQKAIRDWRPDVLCTIDYPGMNLRLAAYAKSLGIRTVHVVCPQVWAWRSGRIPKIESSLDALCCFLPFEPAFFKEGFAHFVGHPLVEEFANSFALENRRNRHRGSDQRPLVALLPGSRIGEIEHILPIMLATMRRLKIARAVIPAANPAARAAIDRVIARDPRPWPEADGLKIQDGGARNLLIAADAALVASGTATFEAALALCPTILVYRVQPFVAWVARRVIRGVKHLGLLNIIWDFMNPEASDDPPMPELLQEHCNSSELTDALRTWLIDSKERAQARRRLAEALKLLETDSGTIERITDIVLDRNTAPDTGPLTGATIDEW